MKRILTLASATALIALAGCGDGSTTPEVPATGNEPAVQNSIGNDVQAQLESLPEGQRNGVFIRAIRDTQGDCQHVERSERGGDYQGLPVWRAHCQNGATYFLVITNEGIAQVLNETEANLVTNLSAATSSENAQ